MKRTRSKMWPATTLAGRSRTTASRSWRATPNRRCVSLSKAGRRCCAVSIACASGRVSFSRDFRRARAARHSNPPRARPFSNTHRASYDELVAAMKGLEAEIAALPTRAEELVAIARRGAELRGEISFLLESNEKNYVYWFERRGKGIFLAATPIDVSAILRERLFEAFDTVVLTSATLAVGGGFEFLEAATGYPDGSRARLAARVRLSHPGHAVHSSAPAGRARRMLFRSKPRRRLRGCWNAPRAGRFAFSPATAR